MSTINSDNGLSKASYDIIVEWVKIILPKRNRLKKNFYTAKFMIKPFSLGYQKIDMCSNFCILNYLENVDFTKCKICRHARYKLRINRGRTLVAYRNLKYFSITPKLQKLFMLTNTTKHIKWHHSYDAVDEVMMHTSNGEA